MTTTTPVLKFTKGSRSLNLNSGRYKIGVNFVPPATAITSQYSGNISANKTGGASLVGQRATNRSFSFDVEITGSSEAEVRRGMQDVAMFLSWAGDESEPLYLEYNPNSDTSEPLWGNYGTNLRYEIVDGSITPDSLYMTADLRGDTLPKCRVSLTIKPFALGKRQRLASAIGGVTQDITGVTDGTSRGVTIAGTAKGDNYIRLTTASDTWDDTAGAVRICWTPSEDSTAGTTQYFFDTSDAAHTGGLRAYFGLGTANMIGGGATISGAMSWSTNDKIVSHFTWGPAGLAIYKNGTTIATGTAYTEGTAGTSIYITSDDDADLRLKTTINGFAIFDDQLTAAQVLNDYTNIAQIMTDSQCAEQIPYLFTWETPDTVYNYYDGTNKQNWCTCAGIPGNEKAQTIIVASGTLETLTTDTLYLGLMEQEYSGVMTNFSCLAGRNTGTVDVTTSATGLYSATISAANFDFVQGKEVAMVIRANDSGTTAPNIRLSIVYPMFAYSSDYTAGSFVGTPNTSFDMTPSLVAFKQRAYDAELGGTVDVVINCDAKRTAGTGNIIYTGMQIYPRPFCRINALNPLGGTTKFVIYNGDATAGGDKATYIGDVIDFTPNYYNTLIANHGYEGVAAGSSNTLTYSIYVIPRWSLL